MEKEDQQKANESFSGKAVNDQCPVSNFRNIITHEKFGDIMIPCFIPKTEASPLKNMWRHMMKASLIS